MRHIIAILAGIMLSMVTLNSVIADEAVKSEPDQRLAQKVTIRMTNTRLHTVLEELSKQTGVTIGCGINQKDWQVRDIPVVVCAKDVPLGNLLQAIAESTHLLFSAERIDNIRTYRIWRDKKRQLELGSYEEKLNEWCIKNAEWECNTISKVKDLPESVLQGAGLNDFSAREMSRFIAALGPDVWRKTIYDPNKYITVDISTASPEVKKTFVDTVRGLMKANGFGQETEWTDDQLENSYYQACCSINPDGSLKLDSRFKFKGQDPQSKKTIPGMAGPYISLIANAVADVKDADIPAKPERPAAPSLIKSDFSAKIWSTKIDIEAPQVDDKTSITTGDLWAAVSDATGYALVAENFHGHQIEMSKESFGKRLTPKIVEEYKATSKPEFDTDNAWKADEKRKIIIGMDALWTCDHNALMPEAELNYLKAKLDGEGVSFDDFADLLGYSQQQRSQWIDNTKAYKPLSSHEGIIGPRISKFWQFYLLLNKSQRKMLLSDKGLKIDDVLASAWINIDSDIISSNVKLETAKVIGDKWDPDSYSFDINGIIDGNEYNYHGSIGTFPVFKSPKGDLVRF